MMVITSRSLIYPADRHNHVPPLNGMVIVMLVEQDEPATYKEAMEGPESEKWLEAMKSEIGSMYDNQVWTMVDIPEGRKAVENKWIFNKKTDADGNVTVYKARIVAKGSDKFKGLTTMKPFHP